MARHRCQCHQAGWDGCDSRPVRAVVVTREPLVLDQRLIEATLFSAMTACPSETFGSLVQRELLAGASPSAEPIRQLPSPMPVPIAARSRREARRVQ